MLIVISILFRYNRELKSTSWSSIRQGALLGLFTGWLYLTTYIINVVGFTFGSILMSDKNHSILNISDIILVSALH
jgi:hypothetical protein